MKVTHVMAWAGALALAGALPSQEVTLTPNEEVFPVYTVPKEPIPPGPVAIYRIRLGAEVYGIVTTAPPVKPTPPCPVPVIGTWSEGEVVAVLPEPAPEPIPPCPVPVVGKWEEGEVVGVYAEPVPLPPPPLPGVPSVAQTQVIYGVHPPQPVVPWPNPVPTRIEGTYFGYQFHPSTPIEIECFIYGEEYSTIRLSGGMPGAEAALFCSEAFELNYTPWGAFLVPTTCVVIPGWFDANGVFEYPVNLGLRELCEQTFYFQGVEWKGYDAPCLSWGLALRFALGNEQPKLGYHLPPMQAILCKTVLEEVPILHSVLIRFEAAESYVLDVEDVVFGRGGMKTKIYVSLKSPGAPWGDKKWHRVAVDVGKEAVTPWIEVWVALDHTGGALEFERGAVIKTEF